MRTIFCVLATLMLGLTSLQAQSLKAIKLNAPDKTRGASVMKALADRHSEREFANKKLSLQDLSDLMWAAIGINREDGKRTAASALNKQDVDVYVLMEEGAYLYDPKQTSVNSAPACLLMVSDVSKFGNVGTPQLRERFGALDAGLVSQNIALFCSGCGLVTVPRGSMEADALKKVLKLSDSQIPMINHPVGYAK